jgi:hypothetical protein
MLRITLETTEAEALPGQSQPIGRIEWSDGCNSHWYAFRAAPSGEIQYTGESFKTLVRCVLIDEETGKSIADTGAEEMPFWPDDAVSYELRDGQLWLYTSKDKSNALVFR